MDGETPNPDANGNDSGLEPIILDSNGNIVTDAGSSDTGGIPVVEPASITSPEENGIRTGRRGRPRGSRNAPKQQSQKEVQNDLTGLLLSLHLMGATLMKCPELVLTDDEAAKLGTAVARVNREFGVQIMSPKMAALVNLAIVGGTIYGPRVIAITNNKKKAKAKAKANGIGGINAEPTNDIFTGGAAIN